MSDLIQEVIKNKEDLYSLLGFDQCLDINFALGSLTDNDIKKNYRLMALKYHPDKNYNNNEELDEIFHKLSIANQILSNPSLRSTYDHWYITYRQREALLKDKNNKRIQLIDNLDKNEHLNRKRSQYNNKIDLHALQKNGEQLRKLKQFYLPYGNWDGKIIKKQDKDQNGNNNKWVDSSTLIIEVKGSVSNVDEDDIMGAIIDILQINGNKDIFGYVKVDDDEWIHESNSYLINLIFTHPRIALNILKSWENGEYDNQPNKHQIIITKITRRLDKEYFIENTKFLSNQKIDLNEDIEKLLTEPEILTETIIIN